MRVPLSLALFVLTFGCVDLDADGTPANKDCDDNDRTAYVGAVEICDGIDNDCNGQVDEGVSITAYQDRDGDGFGDIARVRRVCEMPADGVEVAGDCDDFSPRTYPEAEEVCDGADNNCDGEVDEGLGDVFYLDADGDGHGVPGETTTACVVPDGYSRVADDCDDAEPAAWGDAVELCDGIDNDCNGEIDEGLDGLVLHVDADGDGFGDPDVLGSGCGIGNGLVLNGDDCDDADAALNPDTVEIPDNGRTDDCDDYIDELAVPATFPTVDDALAAASDGDVIQLGEGVFGGPFDLRGHDVTFVGEGCDRTTTFGDGLGSVVLADAGHVGDMTITNGVDSGMLIEGTVSASNLCIRENFSDVGGGIYIGAPGVLTLEDSLVGNNASEFDGGGIYVANGAELVAHRVDIRGNRSNHDGGGIAVRSGVVTVVSSVIAGNSGYDDGGAIATREARDPADSGPPPSVHLLNVTLYRNDVVAGRDPSQTLAEQSQGAGIYSLYDGDVRIEDSIVVGHDIDEHAVFFARTRGSQSYGRMLLHDNGDLDIREGKLIESLRGDPQFVDVRGDDPLAWDLHLMPSSPAIDRAVTGFDPDNSNADLGAYGGDLAPVDFDAGYNADTDGDGMTDAWERAWGTLIDVADADADPDGDGLDNLGEFDARTDPLVADHDGDGVLDADDGDPRSPLDQLPTAVLQAPSMVVVGEEVTLDGSASFDDEGDALTWSWSLVPALGSTINTVNGQEVGTFTPDLAGTWTATLTVSDGQSTASISRAIEAVVPAMIVPDDHPDLQTAIDAAVDGDVVAVRPGTWGAYIVVDNFTLTVLGLGAPEEVVLDATDQRAVLVSNNGHVDLRNITLTGGQSPLGGGLYCLQSSASLTDVVIRDNEAITAIGNGGGFWSSLCTIDATRVDIHDNSSGRSGGGMYTVRTTLDFSEVRIFDNTAAQEGGGAWIEQRQEDVSIEHSVFQGNSAGEGSALYLYGSTLYKVGSREPGNGRIAEIDQCAFADHDGNSMVYVEDGRLRMYAPLIAHNDVATVFGGITGDDGVEFNVLMPLFYDNAGLSWLDTVWAPYDVWSLDPHVLAWTDDGDASNDVWTLRPGSPALDLGVPDRYDHDGSRSAVGPSGGAAPSGFAPDSVDLDGDGMSDGWERRFGLDPSVDDSGGDLDGDGRSNGAEYAMGTLP